MVERLKQVRDERLGWGLARRSNGDLCRYSDYEALERQIAELRAENDRLKRGLMGAAMFAKPAAEAENARLRALPLKDEVERVLERIAAGMEVTLHTGEKAWVDRDDAGEMARALLSRLRAGEQEGWREITEDDQPPLDTDVIMGCWETLPKRHWATEIGHYGSKRGGWIRGWMTHWLPLDRLPAAPSEQGGDRG